jgi:hypothetical protein
MTNTVYRHTVDNQIAGKTGTHHTLQLPSLPNTLVTKPINYLEEFSLINPIRVKTEF